MITQRVSTWQASTLPEGGTTQRNKIFFIYIPDS
jgi:hypothetical protein